MNFTVKNGAILVGLIIVGVAGGLKLNELLNRAKMPVRKAE